MAVTTINLSDTISQWVTKTNTISTDLGDKALLQTIDKTNTVSAINELFNRKTTDSAAVGALFADTSNIDVTYDGSGTGLITHIVKPNSLLSSNFNSVVNLQIYDSSGSLLKTLFSPGS